MLNVALPKGRLGEKVYAMFASAGFECPEVLMESRNSQRWVLTIRLWMNWRK